MRTIECWDIPDTKFKQPLKGFYKEVKACNYRKKAEITDEFVCTKLSPAREEVNERLRADPLSFNEYLKFCDPAVKLKNKQDREEVRTDRPRFTLYVNPLFEGPVRS